MKYDLIDLKFLNNHELKDIKSFLKHNGVKKFDNYDLESLKVITPFISKVNRKQFSISYVIDHLDKEFDMIKVGNRNVVNIELKVISRDAYQCKINYQIQKK